MVNAVKYHLECIIAGDNLSDDDIARIGKSLADGAELNVTDDTSVGGVNITKLNAEVTKTLDLLEEDETPQL